MPENQAQFSAGQNVKVTGQRPPTSGTIEKVSTWREVVGPPSPERPCYFIRCQTWGMQGRWIDEGFVEADGTKTV